jgi:hypothetical protein
VNSKESLTRFADINRDHVKVMTIENKLESELPPEMVAEAKRRGANSTVGPFVVRGVYMLFFVFKIDTAKKRKFVGSVKENYKKIAAADFAKKVLLDMYRENEVKFYVSGKEVDVNKLIEDAKKESNSDQKQKTNQINIDEVTDDTVLATIGKLSITAKKVCDFYSVKSFKDNNFVAMSTQFNMPLSQVALNATKLVVDDTLLTIEVEKGDFKNKPEVKKIEKDVRDSCIAARYLKKHGKFTAEDTKAAYNEVIQAIPPEDRNENEVAVKMVFFKTKDEAEKNLGAINSGREKFSDLFKNKENNSAINLGYVNKKSVQPELWTVLKQLPTGVCCKSVIEVDGGEFGLVDMNYAIIYVGDKRPLQLPSLSNPEEKKYFEALAQQKAIFNYSLGLLKRNVVSIDGKPIEELAESQPFQKILGIVVAQSPMS